MRMTNLLVLFVSASLVIETDLVSAHKASLQALCGPTKLDNHRATSSEEIQSVDHRVQENRAWLTIAWLVEFFVNLFKSRQQIELERALASKQSELERALAYKLEELKKALASTNSFEQASVSSKIKDKLVSLKKYLDNAEVSLNKDIPTHIIDAHRRNARDFFKSPEFVALFDRLKTIKNVDGNYAMYNLLEKELGAERTAYWLWLVESPGKKKAFPEAAEVEEAQFAVWLKNGGRPLVVAMKYLNTPAGKLDHLRDKKHPLNDLLTSYWKYVRKVDLGI